MSAPRAISLWAPVLALMALEFGLSSMSEVPGTRGIDDKVLHVSGYAVLGLLALRACHGGIRIPRWAPAMAAAAMTVGYGVLDEIHQSFVPGRTADIKDVIADAVGFLAALAAVALVARRGKGRTV